MNCSHCGETIPMTMVQQDGMHLYCHEKPIRVWKVTYDGSSFFDKELDFLFDMIEESDIGSEYIISSEMMTVGRYQSLPEFMGF